MWEEISGVVQGQDGWGYSGRVKNTCEEHKCSLRITDLRESDADQYQFRIITKSNKYFGQTGVKLYIRDPEVVVRRENSGLQLECLSRCPVPTSYIWFKNGRRVEHENSQYYSPGLLHTDRYSCALRGNEEFSSPSVYAPEFPSVSVNTSTEIEEGSSVTLTCSSDANPAANYTWYKKNGTLHLHLSSSEAQIVFSSTKSSDSGEYYCDAENELGRSTSKHISIKVQGLRFKVPEKHPPYLFDKSASTMNIIRLTLSVVMLIPLLLLTLWSRKKKTLSFTSEPSERVEMIELDSGLEFKNVSAVIAARTEDAEEQESMV
ncbi:B-cell receptor CD22-like [Notolabrus celidotus]|uniref:B-cell receptor CD22-like n=1 Tax=Notolabrus celidotus TaxID=1203425 RepID=UPI00148FFDA7|nr:B-cell receptor CD22-like [Notolabrus celidotus]